jgi:hypothetical protein
LALDVLQSVMATISDGSEGSHLLSTLRSEFMLLYGDGDEEM